MRDGRDVRWWPALGATPVVTTSDARRTEAETPDRSGSHVFPARELPPDPTRVLV